MKHGYLPFLELAHGCIVECKCKRAILFLEVKVTFGYQRSNAENLVSLMSNYRKPGYFYTQDGDVLYIEGKNPVIFSSAS